MSYSKVVSRNLLSIVRLLAATVLLSLVAISQAAPLRQQREVVHDVTVIVKPPSNSTILDCIEVSAARNALHGTQEEVDMYAALAKAYQDGKTLTFDDLKLVYAPSCKRGSHETDRFVEVQCFTPEHSWPADLPSHFCWCADEITGHPINGTIREELINDCGAVKSCQVEDVEIPHGEEYKQEGSCQICTCSNGVLVCYKTLSSDEGENITAASLYILKVQLLKLMYVERYNVKNSDSVTDERAIEAMTYTLPWKWDTLKKNWIGHLYSRSVRKYANEDVSQFTCSYSIVNNFEAILNTNSDDGVDQTEFTYFFNLSTTKNEEQRDRINTCFSPDSTSGASGVDPSC